MPTYLGQFSDRILVRCPRCVARAYLRRLPRDDGYTAGYRLICAACTRADDWVLERDRLLPQPCSGPELYGFGLTLWLQSACRGEVLWAYNAEHLSFLKKFIGANLRERRIDAGCSNRSIGSRLPGWMLAGKNRDQVMRSLAALQHLAAES